jgi:flagellar protein FlgJ
MSLPGSDLNALNGLAADGTLLDRLKAQAKTDPQKALRQVATQFESVFLNMMLKSMRDASPQNGPFDSEQTRLFTSMLDQQLAQTVSNRGVGLADVLVRQLGQSLPQAATPAASSGSAASAYNQNSKLSFIQNMLPHALEASRTTGVPAQLILGQAALESGWGRGEISMPDGSRSHNLFGIKASRNWSGKVASVTTTEYQNGTAGKTTGTFRAYSSYAEAFKDYATLLKNNPRFAAVLQQTGSPEAFAAALQKAGYATDPSYADKLTQVIGQVSRMV